MNIKALFASMAVLVVVAVSIPFAQANISDKITIQQENSNDSNTPQFDWQPIAMAKDKSFLLLVEMVNLTFDSTKNTVSFMDNLIVAGKGFIVSDKIVNCNDQSVTVLDAAIYGTDGKMIDSKTFDPPLVVTKDKTAGTLQEYENQVMCSLVKPE
jgi:hypothetical protein